jgi:flavin reductase (DIM6/NTAB) family NADH-FMN oxidoreductase RutF
MFMDKTSLGPRPLLFPMPVVLVGANVGGKPNFMTVAWAGISNWVPPMVSVAINHVRHTNKGIKENKTFSVNVPSKEHIVEADYCGMVSGSRIDKSNIFETFYGKLGTAPMISECPVCLECRLHHIIDLGSHDLFTGEIVEVYVDNKCMTDGVPDIKKINPLIYSSSTGDYWGVGDFLGKGYTIGKGYKK